MKIKNLVNITAVKSFADSKFEDNTLGTIIERQLEHVDPKLFEKKYPGLSFMNSGIDINNEGGYASTVTSLRIDSVGEFTSSSEGSNDKGKISISGEKSQIFVKDRNAFSEWTKKEVERAKLGNINLPSKYLSTTNMVYQRELDRIGYLGMEDFDTSFGLLNHPDFATSAATGTIDSFTEIEMYNVIANLIVRQRNRVENTPEYMANRVDMPVRVMNILAKTILNSAASPDTVIVALRKNFPDVTFSTTAKADDDSLVGGSATVAYSNDSEGMKMRIPLPLEFSPIDQRGFSFYMEMEYSIAGLDVLVPESAEILSGL